MQVDDMELAEVTVCEKGVNQAAGFDILKADDAVETCIDGSCLFKEETPLEGIKLMTDANDQIDFTQSFLAFAQEEGLIEKAEEVGSVGCCLVVCCVVRVWLLVLLLVLVWGMVWLLF